MHFLGDAFIQGAPPGCIVGCFFQALCSVKFAREAVWGEQNNGTLGSAVKMESDPGRHRGSVFLETGDPWKDCLPACGHGLPDGSHLLWFAQSLKGAQCVKNSGACLLSPAALGPGTLVPTGDRAGEGALVVPIPLFPSLPEPPLSGRALGEGWRQRGPGGTPAWRVNLITVDLHMKSSRSLSLSTRGGHLIPDEICHLLCQVANKYSD